MGSRSRGIGGLTRGLSESRLRMRLVNADKESVKKRRWGVLYRMREVAKSIWAVMCWPDSLKSV